MISSPTLPEQVLENLRQSPEATFVGDSSEGWVANEKLLRRAHQWGAALRSIVSEDEEHIGILLPPSVSGVAAALGAVLADKCPVFLNYTASREAIEYAIENCGIRRILTVPGFAAAVEFPESPILTDLRTLTHDATEIEELCTQPSRQLRESYFPKQGGDDLDQPATILFSSGSTGRPKGVILTNQNIRANLEDVFDTLHLNPDDVVLGFLPFFHSFGFLATLWLPLSCGRKVYYHPNPTDAAAIGDIATREKPTVLFATPTFLQMYMRRCDENAFESVRLIVTGAEKMRTELACAFRDRFGVLPVEGYGTTELSPVVSINLPSETDKIGKDSGREGAVGKPLRRVSLRIVDPETEEDVSSGEEGLLLVHGPNVMRGYLNDPDRTNKVLKDGWYNTGDIARIDEDGYLFITGRLSRFSKIAGEMIPHGAVEEALQEAAENHALVVAGAPDPRRGEKLVVLYTDDTISPAKIVAALRDRGLPNLWIPKPNAFYAIDQIPLLGTGKLDLRAINDIAKEKSQ